MQDLTVTLRDNIAVPGNLVVTLLKDGAATGASVTFTGNLVAPVVLSSAVAVPYTPNQRFDLVVTGSGSGVLSKDLSASITIA